MKSAARIACLIFVIWLVGCGVIALSGIENLGTALGYWSCGVLLCIALGVLVKPE